MYAVPPVQYPDGRWYIKLGAEVLPEVELASPAAIGRWMAGEAEGWEPYLEQSLRSLLSDVNFMSTVVKPCVYARTPSLFPYIDRIADRVVVAAGGNGRAAKSADAIGAIAVGLAHTGAWTDPLDREHFRVPR